MPRPSNTKERRKEIADALLKVMSDKGYDKASVQAIAKQAGLNQGLLHYHFKSKQDILVEAICVMGETLVERLAGTKRLAADKPWKRLEAHIDTFLGLGEGANKTIMNNWVTIGSEAVRKPDVREAYENAIQSLMDLFLPLVRDVLHADSRTTRNARKMTAAILSTIEGAFRLGVAARGALPIGFGAPMLKSMVRGLVQSEALR